LLRISLRLNGECSGRRSNLSSKIQFALDLETCGRLSITQLPRQPLLTLV